MDSKTQHTPGPWAATSNDVTGVRPLGDDGIRFWDIHQPEAPKWRGSIARVMCALNIEGITIEERDANARLIAAAPEMYEALGVARSALFDDGAREAAIRVIDATIAKAKGR